MVVGKALGKGGSPQAQLAKNRPFRPLDAVQDRPLYTGAEPAGRCRSDPAGCRTDTSTVTYWRSE